MMRQRVGVPLCAGARAISTFNFGHADLSSAFGGKQLTLPAEVPATLDTGVKVTRLNNGTRVVTHSKGGPLTSVGMYFAGGAQFDPAEAPGLSSIMRYALEGGNFDNSNFQIVKTHLAFALNTENSEIRKQLIGLKLTGRTDAWKMAFNNLMSCFAAPRFAEADFERFRDHLDVQHEEKRWTAPRDYAVERLEETAFAREALGNPRNSIPAYNGCTGPTNLINQWAALCVPSRVVVVGVNVPHDELVATYENGEFPHSATAPHHTKSADQREAILKRVASYPQEAQFRPLAEKFEYENRAYAMQTKPFMENETIAAVGFRTFGADQVKQYATAVVLQGLLDQALNEGIRYQRHFAHHGTRSFYRPFQTVGLIGFTTRTSGASTAAAVLEASKLFTEIKPTKETVAAAVQRALVRIHREQMEKVNDYTDFLAGSIVGDTENVVTAEALFKAVQDVTPADATKARDAAIATAPAMFATGDTNIVPSLRHMGFQK